MWMSCVLNTRYHRESSQHFPPHKLLLFIRRCKLAPELRIKIKLLDILADFRANLRKTHTRARARTVWNIFFQLVMSHFEIISICYLSSTFLKATRTICPLPLHTTSKHIQTNKKPTCTVNITQLFDVF